MTEATISGPLGKKASFFFEFERRDIGDTSVINATVLDRSLQIAPYRQSVMSPTVHPELSVRLDYQLSKNHTLVGRYELEDRSQENAGLDAFSLPTRAYQLDGREQFVQLTESAVLSPTALNEVRFQYRRDTSDSSALSFDPVTLVPQAFSDGGANVGLSGFVKNRWELTNVFSLSRGPHTIKLGGRIRMTILDDESMQNFNGMFRFDSMESYQTTEMGLTNGLTGQQIRVLGGGASQFSLTQGNPFVGVNQIDGGLFIQDDWRVAPKLTLSGGLRYELQNNISDWHDFAPRVGFAWAPGRNGQPFVVVRGGFGLFYQRVSETLTLNAKRLNGTRQRQYLIMNPDFYPTIPSPDLLAANAAAQAIRVMQPSLRAPRLMQMAFSVERQLLKGLMTSVTYSHTRSWDTLLSRNVNAPLRGTYDPSVPGSGIRPLGGSNDVYAYVSGGSFRQHQLIFNANARPTKRTNLFGFYVLNMANSDSDGAENFPANQYDLPLDYSRSAYDIRHRMTLGGTITAPFGFSFSPFVVVHSGAPFNITTGQDLNGDSIYTDRPAWATDLTRASVVRTKWGNFDTDPLPGQTIIPRNLGGGPAHAVVNLRASRSFGFGRSEGEVAAVGDATPHASAAPIGGWPGGGGGHFGGHTDAHGSAGSLNQRYVVTFSVSARNLLNTVNLAVPIGNLSSPMFGTSNAIDTGPHSGSAGNRTIELQTRFSF